MQITKILGLITFIFVLLSIILVASGLSGDEWYYTEGDNNGDSNYAKWHLDGVEGYQSGRGYVTGSSDFEYNWDELNHRYTNTDDMEIDDYKWAEDVSRGTGSILGIGLVFTIIFLILMIIDFIKLLTKFRRITIILQFIFILLAMIIAIAGVAYYSTQFPSAVEDADEMHGIPSDGEVGGSWGLAAGGAALLLFAFIFVIIMFVMERRSLSTQEPYKGSYAERDRHKERDYKEPGPRKKRKDSKYRIDKGSDSHIRSTKPKIDGKYCGECGEKNDSNAQFCGNCGKKI